MPGSSGPEMNSSTPFPGVLEVTRSDPCLVIDNPRSSDGGTSSTSKTVPAADTLNRYQSSS